MQFKLSRISLVSAAASLVGIALVVSAVFLLRDGHQGDALMRAGTGLYCCIWAFVPYDEFLRVARLRVRLRDSVERKAVLALFPARLLLPMLISSILIISGLAVNVLDAFH